MVCPGDFQSPNNGGLHFLSVSLQASSIPGSLLSPAWKPLSHLQGPPAPTPSFHTELGMQPFTHPQQTGTACFFCIVKKKHVHEYTHTCSQISAASERESLQSHNVFLSAKVKQSKRTGPSCLSSHTVNKYIFHGLFSPHFSYFYSFLP